MAARKTKGHLGLDRPKFNPSEQQRQSLQSTSQSTTHPTREPKIATKNENHANLIHASKDKPGICKIHVSLSSPDRIVEEMIGFTGQIFFSPT